MGSTTPDSQRYSPFPSTMWSEILAIRDPASPEFRRRMDHLVSRYWQPVYSVIRSAWTRDVDQARDLTQEFFVAVLEGDVFGTASPGKGSFRSYIRAALKNFLLNEKKRVHRIKRGGGRQNLSLDFDSAADLLEPAAAGADPGELLDRAWARQLLNEGLAELRDRLTPDELALFEEYESAPDASVRELAKQKGIAEYEVWKAIWNARKALRSILMDRAREYVGSQEDLFKELEQLLGRPGAP